MIIVFGLLAFIGLPKEDNPEIKIPYIFVTTLYPGVAPADIETLITKPIEKQLKSLSDVKRVSSTSGENYSSIAIEFNTNVEVEDALQKVRDKVNIAKPDLPDDAEEPEVVELNFERMPAMIISLSGPYDLVKLKTIAENLQDKIDGINGVLDTELVGGLEDEIRVVVDSKKLGLYLLSFDDVIGSLSGENINIPGGQIDLGKSKYLVRVPGEFESVRQIPDLVVAFNEGNPTYIRDLARVEKGYKESSSFSRYKTKNSVSIQVIRRSGENLIQLSQRVNEILQDMSFPNDLNVAVIGDRAENIESMVNELTNSIITGMLLVVLVLLFFFGKRNALFVGVAIPLSMLMSFVILQFLDITLNMVVLFSLILALGMLVDNGIVIVENIFRHRQEGRPLIEAAKVGTGEVAWPVIASTCTTLAAFAPMIFWPGIMGEFMKYLPITLVVALSSSLFVALFVTPVLCSIFMKIPKNAMVKESKSGDKEHPVINKYRRILESLMTDQAPPFKGVARFLFHISIIFCVFAGMQVFKGASTGIDYALHLSFVDSLVKIADHFGLSIILAVLGVGLILYVFLSGLNPKQGRRYFLAALVAYFITLLVVSIPLLDQISGVFRLVSGIIISLPFVYAYLKFVDGGYSSVRRGYLIYSFVILFFAATSSVSFLNILFFPRVTPERIMVNLTMPQGTSLEQTDSVISEAEAVVAEIAQRKPTSIRHYVTNVGTNSADVFSSGTDASNKAEITIDFYRSEVRKEMLKAYSEPHSEIDPFKVIEELRTKIERIPGGKFSIVEQEGGPPTGKPISIQVSGDEFEVLLPIVEKLKSIVKLSEGVINLDDTYKRGSPEITVEVNREQAARLGINTYRIASTLRTAINGNTATVFRDGDDEIDIVVKLEKAQSNDLDFLRYVQIPGKGNSWVPLSQVAEIKTSGGKGAINRVDFERVIFVEAEISQESGRNSQSILKEIESNMKSSGLVIPTGYSIQFKGEQEDQQESQAFLSKAFLIALFLIALILISQFNSLVIPFIVLFSVVLSFIGVVLGLFIAPTLFEFEFKVSPFVIIMTGVGIISLAGVVVNNAIVLLDYIRQLRADGLRKNDAIVQAGVVRFRPVMLTAITTVLGLIPMSAGFTLDFVNRIYGVIPSFVTGSSSSEWWAPLANSVIFGLVVATLLTLVMVPVFYYALDNTKDN
jgi:multidrug efflux pump subunit AcrB